MSRVTRAPSAAAERLLTTVLLSTDSLGTGQPGAGHPQPATRTTLCPHSSHLVTVIRCPAPSLTWPGGVAGAIKQIIIV